MYQELIKRKSAKIGESSFGVFCHIHKAEEMPEWRAVQVCQYALGCPALPACESSPFFALF